MPLSSKNSTRLGPSSADPVFVAPWTIRVAFWLYLVAAVVELVAVVISLVQAVIVAQPVSSSSAVQSGSPVPGGSAIGPGAASAPSTVTVVPPSAVAAAQAQLALTIVVTALIAAVAIAALIYFAVQLRRGHAWTRIVLLVMAILSPSLVTHPLGAARVAVVVVATVLVFLAPSVAWFRTMRYRRAVELVSR